MRTRRTSSDISKYMATRVRLLDVSHVWEAGKSMFSPVRVWGSPTKRRKYP